MWLSHTAQTAPTGSSFERAPNLVARPLIRTGNSPYFFVLKGNGEAKVWAIVRDWHEKPESEEDQTNNRNIMI
jgi:hypothetical protein